MRKQPELKQSKKLMMKKLPALQLRKRQQRKKQLDLSKRRLLKNFWRLNFRQKRWPKS